MNKEEYNKLSTFDKIEFDIEMKMYMKHNDKIASIYDNLGDIYTYKDLEEAKTLEEHETLKEYKKTLKEKCEKLQHLQNLIDKATNYYLKELSQSVYMDDVAVEMFNLLEDNK